MTGKKRRSKKPGFYNIYSDGSAYKNGRVMGAGWVILKGHHQEKYLRSNQEIGHRSDGSSTIAEIYAVCYALHAIQDPANIIVHTDEPALRKR